MLKIIGVLLLVFSPVAYADVPVCQEHSGGNFCQYDGTVSRIYVNKHNIILVYFDTPIDASIPSGLGFNVNYGNAGALNISENPEFANFFYSTALAAQASKRQVQIQMRGSESGYLKIDRIWLSE